MQNINYVQQLNGFNNLAAATTAQQLAGNTGTLSGNSPSGNSGAAASAAVVMNAHAAAQYAALNAAAAAAAAVNGSAGT